MEEADLSWDMPRSMSYHASGQVSYSCVTMIFKAHKLINLVKYKEIYEELLLGLFRIKFCVFIHGGSIVNPMPCHPQSGSGLIMSVVVKSAGSLCYTVIYLNPDSYLKLTI